MLTPLTARAIGTGFAAVFVASMWFIWENSSGRGRVGTVSYLLVGALQLLAIARYPGTVEWDRPGTWLYIVFMAAILGAGIFGTIDAWRGSRASINPG
jgi:hypothetical protein